MMIRINLLPVRQVKKREMGRQVIVLFLVVLVFGVVLNYLWYEDRQKESAARAAKVSETQASIAELDRVIGEVNNINRRKKEVEDKLKVLTELKKGRSGPVRMLDALATATPKNVTLKDFDEKTNAVKLVGIAESHDDVAEFMRSLTAVVWTPKGMGRLIEKKRDAKVVRVELLASDGALEEFPLGEVGTFFTNIDLKKAEQKDTKELAGSAKRVDFEINLNANYAI